ncbi:MAG: hypothetical protein GQ477_01335 [Nanohaloarchaea archaeon]|nr:hypothetical protein [Candidatus Nanohaloarchaea archaeon]
MNELPKIHYPTEQSIGVLNPSRNKAREKKDKIHALTIQDKYIDSMWAGKRARETVQYGAAMSYDEADAIILAAREFTLKMKLVINELNEAMARAVHEKLQELSC